MCLSICSDGDRGGNKIKLQSSANWATLHDLWDDGGGVFYVDHDK